MESRMKYLVAAGIVAFALGACDERKPRISAFCGVDAPCPSSEQCLNGTCFPTCAKNTDCDGNLICYQGVCVEPCDASLVCPTEPQTICVDGACYPADPPGIIEAEGPENVNEQDEVTLNADNSLAYEPETVVFEWDFIASNPKGITVQPEILEAKADTVVAPTVRFVAPKVVQDTVLLFELTMRDSAGRTKKDSIQINVLNVINEAPTILISGAPSGDVASGDTIQLVAEAGDENPGSVLVYSWEVSSSPSDVALELVDISEEKNNSAVSFVVPEVSVDTTFSVTAIVTDGTDTTTETVMFTVLAPVGPPECTEEEQLACDDGNVCTDDSCDPETGCSYTFADGQPCDDSDACTVADTCANSACVGGGPLDCDDLNGCTIDSCDGTFGCLTDPADGLGCDDGNPCSTDDQCSGGLCVGLPLCEDGNPCTKNECNDLGECAFPLHNLGYPCETDALCNGFGQCLSWTATPVNLEEFGSFSTSMLTAATVSGGLVSAVGYLQPSATVPGTTTYELGMIASFYIGDGAWIDHVRLNGLLDIDRGTAVGRYGAVTESGEGWWDSNSIGWLSSDHDLLSISSRFIGNSESEDWGPPLVLVGTGYGSEGVFGKAILCATWNEICDYVYMDGPAAPIQQVLLVNHAESSDGVLFTVPHAFAFAGLSVEGEPTRIYGRADVENDIWDGSELPTWSAKAPLGCDPNEFGAPCAGVTEWFDVHEVSEGDVWATGDHGHLLHFDGSWNLVPLGGLEDWVDPKTLDLRSVFATGDAVWIVAEMPGCGNVDCFSDPTYRSVVLLHLDRQTGEWFPQARVMARQCVKDDALSCEEQLDLFGVRDIVFTEWLDVVLVGADLQKDVDSGQVQGAMSFWHIYLGDGPDAAK